MKKQLFLLFFCIPLIFGTCPGGSVEFQNFCYYFQANATAFPNAELACNAFKGHLASIHDGFTNAILTAQAGSYFHESTVTDFWVGLNSLMFPGNWSWTDDTNSSFTEWASAEPQNLSMSCASVAMQNGLWKSDDCFKPKPYVCAVSADPTYPAYVNCSYGWTYFEPTHSCYGVDAYAQYNLNWSQSEQQCEKFDAHLVSIHSYEEAKFFSTLIQIGRNWVWTGLISDDNEVTWKWSDDSPIDYLPWASGHPNLNVSSCGVILYEKIYDLACSNALYLMCKKPAKI